MKLRLHHVDGRYELLREDEAAACDDCGWAGTLEQAKKATLDPRNRELGITSCPDCGSVAIREYPAGLIGDLDCDKEVADEVVATVNAAHDPGPPPAENFRVERVWYGRVVGSDIQADTAKLTLTSAAGSFHQDLGPVGPETYHRARRVAERIGVPLVVEHGLQERVASFGDAP